MHEQVSFNSQEQKLVSRCPVYDHIPNTSKYLTKKLEKLYASNRKSFYI